MQKGIKEGNEYNARVYLRDLSESGEKDIANKLLQDKRFNKGDNRK